MTITTKICSQCYVEHPLTFYHRDSAQKDGFRTNCKACKKKTDDRNHLRSNPVSNKARMFVNGKYIPKSHPLHKPGRYIMDGFGDMIAETDKTKAGYIYIITNPAWDGWIKVGKAIDDKKRTDQYQTYSPYRDYKVEYTVHVDDVHAVETAFHRGRKSHNGEWYFMTVYDAISAIDRIIPQVGRKKHVEGPHKLVPQPMAVSV